MIVARAVCYLKDLIEPSLLVRVEKAGESLPEALCSPLSNRCHQSSEGRDARQENPPFSKPLRSRLEEHPRPISSIPGAPLQPRFELGASFRKLQIAVETLDLGRVFPVGLAALSVLGETAHIWETQLCRDVGGSPRGYVPDIRQEPAEGANRAELYGVPQAVGLTPSPINVASVLVVKEEVALELSLFDLADVATVRGGLVVVEEVYRHPAMVSNSRPLPLSVRFRSIVPQPPIYIESLQQWLSPTIARWPAWAIWTC